MAEENAASCLIGGARLAVVHGSQRLQTPQEQGNVSQCSQRSATAVLTARDVGGPFLSCTLSLRSLPSWTVARIIQWSPACKQQHQNGTRMPTSEPLASPSSQTQEACPHAGHCTVRASGPVRVAGCAARLHAILDGALKVGHGHARKDGAAADLRHLRRRKEVTGAAAGFRQ